MKKEQIQKINFALAIKEMIGEEKWNNVFVLIGLELLEKL